jgi:A/G-specific adenine glycosylase
MRRPGRKPLVVAKLRSVISPQIAAVLRGALLRWFDEEGRDFPWRQEGASLYHLILAELLLQRTRAETVAAFFNQFTGRFPSWQAIANSTIEEIGEVLKPIGLWRRRATSLIALAREMVERNGRFPRRRRELESFPGVGQYIANAILLFSSGRAEPLLDVNMARVLERLFGPRTLVDIRDDPHLQSVSRAVVRGKHAAKINWAILDLGATVCTIKKPQCHRCPLRHECGYAAEHQIPNAANEAPRLLPPLAHPRPR